MASYIDPSFRESLLKKPQDRTAQDLTLINANLKSLEALSSHRDSTIRCLCKTVKYEKHEANDVLYRSGDVINCWYILLSGSVFIDGSMFLPRSGFGRRSAGQSIRVHDCLVLETSEMLVIDYPKATNQLEQTHLTVNDSSTLNHSTSTQKTFRHYVHEDKQNTAVELLNSTVQTKVSISKTNTNLTTFKNLANSSTNSPIILMKLNNNLLKSSIELHNSTSTNDDDNAPLDSYENDLNVDDLNEEDNNNNEIDHENNLDNDEESEENDLHNLNIIYDTNEFNDDCGESSKLDHDQIKSICIITGSSSFNKGSRKANLKHSHQVTNNRLNNNQQQQQQQTLQIKQTQTTKSKQQQQQQIQITNESLLDISQQTISSNNNINTSINTIDTLDDDLNFNFNINNSNQNQVLKLNGKKSQESCSSSIASSKSSSIISSLNQPNAMIGSLTAASSGSTSGNLMNSNNMNNTTGITASTSNSINDDGSEQSIQMAKDAVREVLEKDPKERTDEDIDVLFEFMQTLPAFSNLTEPITRKLCACMVLGVVDKSDTVVLDHNEKLDSWAVVLNGQVECTLPDSSLKVYHVGDHFGVAPVLEPVYHEGVMRTKCDDCQFVLVKQNDYFEILNKSKENTKSYYENNKLVMITEFRPLNNSTDRQGEIVLRASPDRLIERLVNDESYSLIDPTFIQDFLLTYRVFIDQPIYISSKLFECFQKHSQISNNLGSSSPNLNLNLIVKKKVYRIILEWITNHFNDFETNRDLYDFVDKFQDVLNKEKMFEQFRVLTIAISTKSKQRTVTLPRSRRDENLMFSIQGGWEKGYGIFISKVDKESKAHELGIRKGDQILEVNGHSFQHITLAHAMETLKSSTHSSITLKYNPIGFNEMLLHPEKSPHRNKKNFSNSNKAYLFEYLQAQQEEQIQQVDKQQTENNVTTKKSIASMPPLPPSASTTNLTPRNKSKDKTQLKLLQTNFDQKESSSNSNRIGKIFSRFNRKAHSKDLESLSQVDSSAPSLKSITRSPSPSLSTFHSSTTCSSFSGSLNGFNSTNCKSLNNSTNNNLMVTSTSDYSSSLSRNNSSNNLNINDSNNQPQIDTSLAKMSLQDQQQFAVEHVLKIYKNDQTFKYLVVHKETSTKEVVMLALNEFNINDDIGSNAYSLCEVSVDHDRLIKQKRLPDQMNNLAEKLPLNARYYLKCNTSPEQFLSDSASVEELIKDSNISFLQLDPLEIAAQLTLRDYCLFKSIESSEYIDYLFRQKTSKYGYSHLSQFSDLSNEEVYWVINEILHESNIIKRARIIKHFIQIAHICKECKNYNSLFAIVSGLDNFTVTRLKDTWEKVSNKYKKILQDLRQLLDPSFNMNKYRTLFKNESIQPPIIPFFPICQKDLYFTNESSDTFVDGLVNFEKLRKLSKNVRSIVQMTSSPFDLTSMRDVPTSHTLIFSMFGCTNSALIEYRNGGASSHQFAKLNIKADHIKKLYEEAVMVRKVRHYLNNMSKNIERNEQRLRLISSTLEHSTSGHTLKRKPSPNSSLGGSVSSINALNNSNNMHNVSTGSSISTGNALAGITAGNGTLSSHKNATTLFGTHSPDAVKKLLALSETKVKTVKNSSSSSSVPLSHLSNSRIVLNTSTSSVANTNVSNSAIGSISPPTPLSPKTKLRSISSSQPLNKYTYTIPLSSESSSVSTIKLNGKYTLDSKAAQCNQAQTQSNSLVKSNISTTSTSMQNGSEADSGRASMASNVDQDQCSPTFQQRAFILNRYLTNEQQSQLKNVNKIPMSKSHINVSNQEMLLNSAKLTLTTNKNAQNSLEEEDQVSAV